MRINEVKVKSIDDSSKFLYPNRTIEIKTSKQDILTPIRASTDSEYRQKALIPTDLPIENPISIAIEELNARQFDKFMNENGYFAKLTSRAELKNRLSQYSNLSLFLLKPTKSDIKDQITGEIRFSPMTLLKQNPMLLERFLRVNVRMQQEAGLSPISIPFIDLPFKEYSNLIIKLDRDLEKINEQPVFFIDMNYKDFEKALKLIVNTLRLNLVGLYFQSYRRAHISYEVLRNFVRTDVAFFAIQVERVGLNELSTMHYLPFFGNDIYSVEKPRGFLEIDPLTGKPKKFMIYKPENVRLFDKKSLQVRHIAADPSLVENLSDEYRQDPLIPTVLQNYQEATTKEKYEILNAFSKISELNDSSLEFKNFQKFIKQNSTKDYIDEKPALKKTLRDVTGHQVNVNWNFT
ncbi:MAG: hypothetical protein ABSG33_05275 [Candidatus Bathyarchaeia archaeon]|jgi:hypothetical protein